METLCCVPIILEEGSQKFLSYGTTESGGTKLVSISGHVKNRGVFEVGLGISLRQLIMDEKYGGGTSTGRKPGFFHMGGQSGPIGFPEQLDTPYTYETLAPKGLAVGSGAIVVLDDSVCIVEYIQKVFEFFVHEPAENALPAVWARPVFWNSSRISWKAGLRTGMWSAWNTWPGRCPSFRPAAWASL